MHIFHYFFSLQLFPGPTIQPNGDVSGAQRSSHSGAAPKPPSQGDLAAQAAAIVAGGAAVTMESNSDSPNSGARRRLPPPPSNRPARPANPPCKLLIPLPILCFFLKTTVTSVRIPEEDAYYCARNMCFFSRVQEKNPGIDA